MPPSASMRPGDRGVVEEVDRCVGDLAVEPLGSLVDALQRRSGGQQLERAAHREALVVAIAESGAGARIENRDAKPSALARLDCDDLFARARDGRGGARGDRRETGRSPEKEGAAAAALAASRGQEKRASLPQRRAGLLADFGDDLGDRRFDLGVGQRALARLQRHRDRHRLLPSGTPAPR